MVGRSERAVCDVKSVFGPRMVVGSTRGGGWTCSVPADDSVRSADGSVRSADGSVRSADGSVRATDCCWSGPRTVVELDRWMVVSSAMEIRPGCSILDLVMEVMARTDFYLLRNSTMSGTFSPAISLVISFGEVTYTSSVCEEII
ncbi:YhgE/Pip-like protein [Striga asiatica]|uniref:YhgE/Pip-like protein n=1 Tax=Striga asiatica TaxID=4170 RepID=A0A5A7PDU9_STRAF|nr:YhgE/Pip-like protein [Striga asiatica]